MLLVIICDLDREKKTTKDMITITEKLFYKIKRLKWNEGHVNDNILITSEEKLQELLHELSQQSKQKGLRMNKRKTKHITNEN